MPVPCRLMVFLASQAPIGVILRRGPSDWVRLSLWHTYTDQIDQGQWMRGRVYEHRCDLSPDGSLWAYFAYKHAAIHDLGVDSWVALSRPPGFTSLALWKIGTTYFSGGFFTDSHSLSLGGILDAPDRGQLPSGVQLTVEGLPYVDRSPNWTERTVYISRLLRSGWSPATAPEDPNTLWERSHPHGNSSLKLIMAPVDRGLEYALQSKQEIQTLGEATWADWDHQGRLVMAQAGRLLTISTSGQIQEIYDFNPQQPDPQPAPDWAAANFC